MATPRLRISADRVLRRRRPGRRPSRSVGRLAALGLVPALAVGAAVALTVVDRARTRRSRRRRRRYARHPVRARYGHGRGMGQYGAYGYAKNFGWTAERIVGHYYGNTQLGQVADPSSRYV